MEKKDAGVWQDLLSFDVKSNEMRLRGKGGKEYRFYPRDWKTKMSKDDLESALREGRKFSVKVDMDSRAVLGIYEIKREEVESAEKTPMEIFSEELDALLKRHVDGGMSREEIMKVLVQKIEDMLE